MVGDLIDGADDGAHVSDVDGICRTLDCQQ